MDSNLDKRAEALKMALGTLWIPSKCDLPLMNQGGGGAYGDRFKLLLGKGQGLQMKDDANPP
jgi:hypothetical protein